MKTTVHKWMIGNTAETSIVRKGDPLPLIIMVVGWLIFCLICLIALSYLGALKIEGSNLLITPVITHAKNTCPKFY